MTNAEYLDQCADGIIITRCKDCIHCPINVPPEYDDAGLCIRYGYVKRADDECMLLCDDHWYDIVPDPEFFCAKGEKRT